MSELGRKSDIRISDISGLRAFNSVVCEPRVMYCIPATLNQEDVDGVQFAHQ